MCLGIPGKIVEIEGDGATRMGVVDVGGVRRQVDLTCVIETDPTALIGEWVLVHVGFAMSRIDADEAARTLEALAALGEAEEEIAAIRETERMLSAEAAS
ncbi:MAG: HypC/HybG/HupF family hydrogenase formation chaperone [Pseudomonadota bacterium]